MSYIDLRCRWRNIIVLNVLFAPSGEKSDDAKDSFYAELERVFDHFPKNHMKILFGNFSAKLGTDSWDESLQQDSNDNVARIFFLNKAFSALYVITI